MDSEPFEVTPKMTFDALIAADALGRKFLTHKDGK